MTVAHSRRPVDDRRIDLVLGDGRVHTGIGRHVERHGNPGGALRLWFGGHGWLDGRARRLAFNDLHPATWAALFSQHCSSGIAVCVGDKPLAVAPLATVFA